MSSTPRFLFGAALAAALCGTQVSAQPIAAPLRTVAAPVARGASCHGGMAFDRFLADLKAQAVAGGVSLRTIAEASPYLVYDQGIVNRDRGQRVFGQVFTEFAGRMAATYRRTDDGSWDRHQAFIILGPDEETGELVSRAYTDGGLIHEFHIVVEESRLMFADRVPHHVAAVAARKVLTPTTHGYEETLQLDRGQGVFEPYDSIPIQRRDCAVSAP